MITNLVTMILLYQKHYSVTRGRIAYKVYEFINTNYPVYPKGKYFFFSNTKDAQQTVWGESKQVAISLSVSDFFQVYYHDKNIKAYYQDIPESTPSGLQKIDIPSKQFLINQ